VLFSKNVLAMNILYFTRGIAVCCVTSVLLLY
jgi:hypothetical protein